MSLESRSTVARDVLVPRDILISVRYLRYTKIQPYE